MRGSKLAVCALLIACALADEHSTKPFFNLQSGAHSLEKAEKAEGDIEVVARLPGPPGNIDLDEDGRMFFTFHPAANPIPNGLCNVCEWRAGVAHPEQSTWVAYPSTAFQVEFVSVLAVRVDRPNSRLLALDFANMMLNESDTRKSAVFVFDTKTDELLGKHEVPFDIAGKGSMLNDLVISPDSRWLYIADAGIGSGTPAIIVVDMQDWSFRRVLESHPSTLAKSVMLRMAPDDREFDMQWAVGVDSIALDPAGTTLYFAAIFDDMLHKISTDALHRNTDPDKLAELTERVGPKTVSDGITTDPAGNVYITDFQNSAIQLMHPGAESFTLVQSTTLLRWPDGVAVYGGYLYVSCSAIEQVVRGSNLTEHAPFHLVRIRVDNLSPNGYHMGTAGHPEL